MKRSGMVLLGLMAAVAYGGILIIGLAGQVQAQEDNMCIPMGEIVLEAPESVEAKRAPVAFPHAVHFDYTCNTCHHKWSGQEEIMSCSTSGCHDLAVLPKKEERSEEDTILRYYKTAFHKQCIGCHKKIKAENVKMEMSLGEIAELADTGPTGCVKCHPED